MAESDPIYTRTAFKHRGSGISSQLWKAEDHLLLVSRTGASERYYRLFLTEIQALLVRHSSRGVWINVVASLVGALFLLISLGFLSDGEVEGFITFMFIAAPCLIVLIINLVKGTTVDCFVRTSSGLTRMGVVTRLRKADALVFALHEWLDPVQGFLPEDSDVRYMALADGWTPPAPPVSEPVESPVPSPVAPPVVSESEPS